MVNLSRWVDMSLGVFIVKVQLGFKRMSTVAPVLPDDCEGTQEPPMVQVKAGAPASATVISIGTVTWVAALTGLGRTASGIKRVQAASKASTAGLDSTPPHLSEAPMRYSG